MIPIAIDFDGTCVYHEFPRVGDDAPDAVRVIKKIAAAGHKIILWTMRDNRPNENSPNGGMHLEAAENWFKDKEIPLHGSQRNPGQGWTDSPKAYAKIYIDDAALGCPLLSNPTVTERPYVNWLKVEEILIKSGVLK